jgi:hypothetical protein
MSAINQHMSFLLFEDCAVVSARLDGFQTVCVSGKGPFRGGISARRALRLEPRLEAMIITR